MVTLLLLLGASLAAGYYFVLELEKELPDITALEHVQYQRPLTIYSHDQQLIAQFGEMRRMPVAIDQIPRQQINAFLAAEDALFFSHDGVDVKGLLRAATQLISTGKKKQGGSTITMQVARNFLLSNEKTYLRKLKEIMLAMKIEQRFSKSEILALYLNKIYMGQRAYGVAAAAQTYYGKPLNALDLAQQAMIAGLPKAPSLYNPITDPQRALERRNYVLQRMLALQHISQADFDHAIRQVDNARIQPVDIQLEAPYVAEMVRQALVAEYGEDAYTLGLRVQTSVVSHLQLAADHAVQRALHQYDERHGYRGVVHKAGDKANSVAAEPIGDVRQARVTAVYATTVTAQLANNALISLPAQTVSWAHAGGLSSHKPAFLQPGDVIWVRPLDDNNWGLSQLPAVEGAFVALDAHNGALLALSGGFDFARSSYNRAVQSKRQPGSGFKPIIYTAALEKGFTAASIINDAPIVIEDPSQENDWRPENYSRRYVGPTPLRVALRESINLVSIRLLQEVGIPQALDVAKRLGFEPEQLPTTLSLALGSGSAAPLKMAEAYAVFANGGFAVKPFWIEKIENAEGKLLFQATPNTVCADCSDSQSTAPRVIAATTHFLMDSLLKDVVQRGTATAAKQLGRSDIAGKTGTTNEQRDAWFNGYGGGIVASAWLGFDNSAPLGAGETGGKAALPMWMAFMQTALAGLPEHTIVPPPGIVQAYINPVDGLLMPTSNKSGLLEYFTEATAPTLLSTPRSQPALGEETLEAEQNLF